MKARLPSIGSLKVLASEKRGRVCDGAYPGRSADESGDGVDGGIADNGAFEILEKFMGTKEKPTITPEWRVPIYVVGSTVLLAVIMTLQWADLRNRVDASVSIQQAQEWIDNAREQNPAVKWPRLPAKHADTAILLPREAVLARRD